MRRNAFFSPARILVIASHTFTHLVRMKVFYFLGSLRCANARSKLL